MAWELNIKSSSWCALLSHLAQKVLSSRQWQPQPVGHTSWVRNHSIIWLVWPPWPQVRQKLEEPRTATWQMAHWKVKPLQMAHWVPRTSLRQWLQYTPNSGGSKENESKTISAGGSGGKEIPQRQTSALSPPPKRSASSQSRRDPPQGGRTVCVSWISVWSPKRSQDTSHR